jgi:hypothetical protein
VLRSVRHADKASTYLFFLNAAMNVNKGTFQFYGAPSSEYLPHNPRRQSVCQPPTLVTVPIVPTATVGVFKIVPLIHI